MDERHRRPPGVDDDTVAAVGKVTEALEWVERARGRLYDFHQMLGHADELFADAADALTAADHARHACQVRSELVGRNALDGRWSFQIVEEFDEMYWTPARTVERSITDDLLAGRRHVHEAEMKEQRRSHGLPHHESRPAAAHDPSITVLDSA